MMLYKYKAFGLCIHSNIHFKYLLESDGEADVLISYQDLSDRFPELPKESSWFSADVEEFLLQQVNVGRFLVTSGKYIHVDPDQNNASDDYKLYILGTCFGVLLMQRGIIPLHGSALLVDGKGIIIAGESGAGKSTLAAALLKNGHRIITDDIACLGYGEKDEIMIYPGYPSQNLCQDSLERILGMSDNYPKTVNNKKKLCVPVSDYYIDEAVKLSAVFELQSGNVDKVKIESLHGIQKFNSLVRNTYRINLVKEIGFTNQHFMNCSRLSEAVPVYRITRPHNKFSVSDQIELINRYLAI